MGERGYPAYESVAIFFSEPLSPEEMAFVRERAVEYGKLHGIGMKAAYMVQSVVSTVETVIPV